MEKFLKLFKQEEQITPKRQTPYIAKNGLATYDLPQRPGH